MSKTIELTDEQYATITRAAAERGQSPAMLIAEVAEVLRDPVHTPRYFETDEWFRHLGMSTEEIAAVKCQVRLEAEAFADALRTLSVHIREYKALTGEERLLFAKAVTKMVNDIRAGGDFRASLRMKRVEGYPGIYEIT